jgi:predicted Fe-Mo cluster-binding NifX family protein
MDPRFGRCQYFLIVDPQSLEMEALENPNIGASGGAGIQSAQFVANKGVEAIITGQVGPNAFTTLQAAGMKILVGASGKVRDMLEKYKKGQLTSYAQGPTARAHTGMAMGGGRGMGRGMGRGPSPSPPPPAPPASGTPGEELQTLKEESKKLKDQLGSVEERIAKLEKGK